MYIHNMYTCLGLSKCLSQVPQTRSNSFPQKDDFRPKALWVIYARCQKNSQSKHQLRVIDVLIGYFSDSAHKLPTMLKGENRLFAGKFLIFFCVQINGRASFQRAQLIF